jgi:hypothetical protein
MSRSAEPTGLWSAAQINRNALTIIKHFFCDGAVLDEMEVIDGEFKLPRDISFEIASSSANNLLPDVVRSLEFKPSTFNVVMGGCAGKNI